MSSRIEPAENPAAQHIAFLDLIRAVAPLIVFWAHIGYWWCISYPSYCVAKAGTLPKPISFSLDYIVTPLHLYQNGGYFGILLFFLVSGFILTHVSRLDSFWDFAIKRVFRIAPMLIFGILLACLAAYVADRLHVPEPLGFHWIGINGIIQNIFLIDSLTHVTPLNGVTWTLLIEAVFYIFTAALIESTKTRPLASSWILLLLTYIVTVVCAGSRSGTTASWYVMYVCYILVGRAVYLAWAGLVSSFQAILYGISCLTVFFLLFSGIHPEKATLWGADSILYSWLESLLVFVGLAFSHYRFSSRVITFFSDISYSMYLNHLPLASLVMNLLAYKFGLSFSFSLVIAFSVTIVFSFVTYRLIERPGQRLGRRLIRFRLSLPGGG